MKKTARTSTSRLCRWVAPLTIGFVFLFFAGWSLHLERVRSAQYLDHILSQGSFETPCGAINQHGKAVIPFRYKSLGLFNEFGLAIAVDASGHFGCLDRHGVDVIPFEWNQIHEFDSNGRVWASRVSETVSIDTNGRVIETYPFTFVPPFNRHGLARSFEPQRRWRLINRAGEFVSPLEWDFIEPFDEEGFAVVQLETNNGNTKRYGIINETGQWQVEPIWLEIIQQRHMHPAGVKWPDVHSTVFDSRGWCLVRAESGFGWIDKNGFVVSPLRWKSASRFIEFDDDSDSLAGVSDEAGNGYINRSGNTVIPATFVQAGVFDASGLAPAAVGDKEHKRWGWINRSGEFEIHPEWDAVERFAPNGLALVCRNGRWGCIDRTGQLRVEPQWYSVSVWNDWLNQLWRNDGIHVVNYTPDKWLILNHDGQEIQNLGVPPKCMSLGHSNTRCWITLEQPSGALFNPATVANVPFCLGLPESFAWCCRFARLR